MDIVEYNITADEFNLFREFIYDNAGITLSSEKQLFIISRLSKRLRHHSLSTFTEYFQMMIMSPAGGERQIAIDLLTTNETYFFREPKHFSFLEKNVLPNWPGNRPFRVWSAASSSGEEAYSIAMLLDDKLGGKPWEVFGSDISTRVIKAAQRGHYQQARIDGIPPSYLRKYCLKGVGEHEGTLLIDKSLRKRVKFETLNLKGPKRELGLFEVVFLRNVLIYFDFETIKNIIGGLVDQLQPGGILIIGHAESIKGAHSGLQSVAPSVYRKISNGR